MGGFTFERQMTLAPDADRPGRYHVKVSADWNCPVVPQGGMMAAIAARAMGMELENRGSNGQQPTLRSLTTVFAAPVPAGPVTVDVTVLRRGRSMAQARAEIRAPGADAGHTTLAVFGGARPGFEFTDVTMPDVPPPAACPSFRDPLPEGVEGPRGLPIPFWERAEGRPAMGHAPWDDYVPTTSECAYWYRFDDPPHHDDGTLCPLGLIPLCDLNPGSIRERMGPGTPAWMPPSADLTVHLFGETRSEWLLGAYKAHRVSDGYASVAVDLWDPITGLVAHATQVMILMFPDGPPVGEQRFPADQRRA